MKSQLVTVVLLILVILLQFDKCQMDAEHKRISTKQTKEIIESFKTDTHYIDSIIVSRKVLFEAIKSLGEQSVRQQDTILSKQEVIMMNQIKIMVVQKEILDLAGQMKSLPQYKQHIKE